MHLCSSQLKIYDTPQYFLPGMTITITLFSSHWLSKLSQVEINFSMKFFMFIKHSVIINLLCPLCTVLQEVCQSLSRVQFLVIVHQAPSVYGILKTKILEWVAIPFSRASFQPRDQIQVSCIAGRFFLPSEPPGKSNVLQLRKKRNNCHKGIIIL